MIRNVEIMVVAITVKVIDYTVAIKETSNHYTDLKVYSIDNI